jgi:hypothetical protein
VLDTFVAMDIYAELERVHAPQQERSRRAFLVGLDAFDELLRTRPYTR